MASTEPNDHPRIQVGAENVADADDFVAVQVGQVLRARTAKPPLPQAVRVENISLGGNASVGKQADVIIGDINLG